MRRIGDFKKRGKAQLALSLTFFMLLFPLIAESWGARLYTRETQPTIVAPSELSPRERSNLQRQYAYEVRQKELLLTPYLSGPEADGIPSSVTADELTEQEKLYRYFGVAMNLAEEGRLEEAEEILQYISDKNPDDRYVKETLMRIRKGSEFKKRGFNAKNVMEASRLKRTMVKNLIKDGIAYYDSENFDMALLKFADALAVDPSNTVAGRYMNELKKIYSKEIEVENMVRDWMTGRSQREKPDEGEAVKAETPERPRGGRLKPGKYASLDERARMLLASAEEEARANIEDAAGKLLDAKRMEYLLLDKRADNLLNHVELEGRIKQILAIREAEEKKSEQFTFGPGDVIQISVRDHPELSGTAVVQLNGETILPLVNDTVIAKGLDVEELAERVTDILKGYVQNPVVNIAVIEYKSKLFYVIDEDSCTPYPITRAYLTLRDALFISDWGNNRALGRVLVIKPSKRNPIIKKVDAFDLIFRGNLENNVRIDDGDVIYVPMTIAAKATKFLYDSIAPFRAIRNARDEYLNLKWNKKDWEAGFRVPATYDGEAQDAKDLAVYGSVKDLLLR